MSGLDIIRHALQSDDFEEINKIYNETPSYIVDALRDDEILNLIKQKLIDFSKNKNTHYISKIIDLLGYGIEQDFAIIKKYNDILETLKRAREDSLKEITSSLEGRIINQLRKRVTILIRRIESSPTPIPADLRRKLKSIKVMNISDKNFKKCQEMYFSLLSNYSEWLDIVGDIDEFLEILEIYKNKVNVEPFFEEINALRNNFEKYTFKEVQTKYSDIKNRAINVINDYKQIFDRFESLKSALNDLKEYIYMDDAIRVAERINSLIDSKKYNAAKNALDSLSVLVNTRYKFNEAVEEKIRKIDMELKKIKNFGIDCDYIYQRLEKIKEVMRTDKYPRVPALIKIIEKDIERMQTPKFEAFVIKRQENKYSLLLKNISKIVLSDISIKLSPVLAIEPNEFNLEKIKEREEVSLDIEIRGLSPGTLITISMKYYNQLTDREENMEIEIPFED